MTRAGTLKRRRGRADTRGMAIASGFLLGLIPFGLWTWWMVRSERAERAARVSEVAPAQVRTLPVADPAPQVAFVRAGSFCRVPGSIGFASSGATLVCTASTHGARPRWRRTQTAA